MIRAADLPRIFKKFMPWLRQDIQKVFDAQGPGWAPLDDSSMEARKAKLDAVSAKINAGQTASLGRRLGREQSRAEKRLAKRSGPILGERMQKLRDSAERSVARQQAIRSEFERITSGAEGPARKEAKKLGERLGRAAGRAEEKIKKYESGHLLGQIANMVQMWIEGSTLVVGIKDERWAMIGGIHNDGGTAGHGAQIKERKFLEWTPARLQKFAEIAAETVVAPMKN